MTPPDVVTQHADPLARFFAYARERERIRLAREAGEPGPWTGDAALRDYSFCNVFREDDRVTRWYARHVRARYGAGWEIVPATVLFRWFNRVTTGEALFCQLDLEGGSAFDRWLGGAHPQSLEHAVRALLPTGPWVTGSYLINTKSSGGRDKLDGVVRLFAQWWGLTDWRHEWGVAVSGGHTLESFWELMRTAPNLKDFMSYEVVTDLRHSLLHDAPDVLTWANAGPGAVRGLNRIHGRDLRAAPPKGQTCAEMRAVLAASRDDAYWPGGLRPWEMREVEHTLCEFDKHDRLSRGEGTVKRRFAPHGA